MWGGAGAQSHSCSRCPPWSPQGTLLASGNPDAVLIDAYSFFCRTDSKPVGDPSLRTLIAGFIAGVLPGPGGSEGIVP